MKAYKKNELELIDGMLIHKESGDVVAVDNTVVDLANELETRVQKAMFLETQPKFCAGPDLDEFKRKSVNDINLFTCDTPLMDKKIEDALAFMDELDDIETTEKLNDAVHGFFDLIMFVRLDTVISLDSQDSIHRFDTPTLGNPLEWDEDKITSAIAEYHGVKYVGRNDEQSE